MPGLLFVSRTPGTGYGEFNITNCALEEINVFSNLKDLSEHFLIFQKSATTSRGGGMRMTLEGAGTVSAGDR
jgi:hypothetical protein